MKPPRVYELTTPSIHNTINTRKTVHNIRHPLKEFLPQPKHRPCHASADPESTGSVPLAQNRYTSGFDVLLRYRVRRLRFGDRRILNRHRRWFIGGRFWRFVDGFAVARIGRRRVGSFRCHDRARLHDQYRAQTHKEGKARQRKYLRAGRDTRPHPCGLSDDKRRRRQVPARRARRARDRRPLSVIASMRADENGALVFGGRRPPCPDRLCRIGLGAPPSPDRPEDARSFAHSL